MHTNKIICARSRTCVCVVSQQDNNNSAFANIDEVFQTKHNFD